MDSAFAPPGDDAREQQQHRIGQRELQRWDWARAASPAALAHRVEIGKQQIAEQRRPRSRSASPRPTSRVPWRPMGPTGRSRGSAMDRAQPCAGSRSRSSRCGHSHTSNASGNDAADHRHNAQSLEQQTDEHHRHADREQKRRRGCPPASRGSCRARHPSAVVPIVSLPQSSSMPRSSEDAPLGLAEAVLPTADGATQPSESPQSCKAAAARKRSTRALARPRDCHRLLAPPRRLLNTFTNSSSTPSANTKLPMRGDQIERVPAHMIGVGIDTTRHAEQAGQVHRQKRQVEADEHGPEIPAAELFIQQAPSASSGTRSRPRRPPEKH